MRRRKCDRAVLRISADSGQRSHLIASRRYWFHGSFFPVPPPCRFYDCRSGGGGRTQRGKSPPPDSDRLLATPSFEKISPACHCNSPQAQIADSSSRNAVNVDYNGAAPTPQRYTQQGAGVVDFIAALRP